MKKLIIILLLLSCNLYSQSYEYIKNQDTIYIILKESKEQISQQYSDFTFHISGNGQLNSYFITAPNKNELYFSTLNKYERNIIVKRREFLKEHKNQIVTINFMDKIGWLKFISIMIHKSLGKIYVINEEDLSKRKLTLKAVVVVPIGFVEM